jgi:hypothetical protein
MTELDQRLPKWVRLILTWVEELNKKQPSKQLEWRKEND